MRFSIYCFVWSSDVHVVDDIMPFLLQIKAEDEEVLLLTYWKEDLETGE